MRLKSMRPNCPHFAKMVTALGEAESTLNADSAKLAAAEKLYNDCLTEESLDSRNGKLPPELLLLLLCEPHKVFDVLTMFFSEFTCTSFLDSIYCTPRAGFEELKETVYNEIQDSRSLKQFKLH